MDLALTVCNLRRGKQFTSKQTKTQEAHTAVSAVKRMTQGDDALGETGEGLFSWDGQGRRL